MTTAADEPGPDARVVRVTTTDEPGPDARVVGYAIKDSGAREEVPGTGMLRDTRTGKGRYDLLPPDAMRRLAQHYEGGAEKYGPHNWEKGGPLSRYLDSMLRHAFAVVAGQTDEDHVIAVAWNAMAIADHQEKIKRGELPADLDDVFTR
jgi:hypothetical protein